MKKKNQAKAMVMSDEELERLRDKITTTPSTLPYAHNVGGAVIKPEDKGKIKGQSLMAMREQSKMQLGQVYDQVKLLVKQAEEIQERIAISEKIYDAELKFKPVVGKTYYLYEKEDGIQQLSFIGPEEWGKSKQFKHYLATVRLLSDHTWFIEHKNEEHEFL